MLKQRRTKQALKLSTISISIIFILVILSVSCPVFSTAEDIFPIIVDFNGVIEKNGLPKPWLLKVNDGKAHVKVLHQGGENILFLRCESSSFSLERNVSVSPEEYPYVSWSWKAVKLPIYGDVRKKTHNDQGLQMIFAFENRKIISYVWDANAPEGTVTDESLGWPINLSIKVIVVNSGSDRINEWISHTRDVRHDYRDLFHEPPPRLKGVRVQANTQYTHDRSEGMIRGITFSNKNEGPTCRNQTPYHSYIPSIDYCRPIYANKTKERRLCKKLLCSTPVS